eukprot:comp21156_c0_seq1/m.28648 comp21156_c0_seq1/g.28648  ORF comp21156_c0_seq1/g.28648 comp21156_c0_seq1/m.28648 type:complete len:293 (-) comp21156_c0_seq1:373-1251(-)
MISVERIGHHSWQDTWLKRFTRSHSNSNQQPTRYSILQPPLTQNSNCTINLARDTHTGNTVLMKTMKRDKDTDVFIRSEVDIHKAVTQKPHPNLVGFVDAIWTPTTVTIIQEYVSGGDLVDMVMEDGPVTEQNAIECISQLLSALAHMHANGYVHGDVKGEHCVLTEDKSTLKLIDFGFASPVDKRSGNAYTQGTLPYTAPEIFARRCQDLTKADIWAAGIVFFSMVTGGFPWEAAVPRDMDYASYTRGNMDGFSDMSPPLATVVRSMLNPDPAMRPTAEQVLNNLTMLKVM